MLENCIVLLMICACHPVQEPCWKAVICACHPLQGPCWQAVTTNACAMGTPKNVPLINFGKSPFKHYPYNLCINTSLALIFHLILHYYNPYSKALSILLILLPPLPELEGCSLGYHAKNDPAGNSFGFTFPGS